MLRWWLLVLAGCGRLGFGHDAPTTTDSGPSSSADSGPLDDANESTGDAGDQAMAIVATRDTYLSNDIGEPNLNFGTTSELRLEADKSERVLLAFDLFAVPAQATITSAALRVYVSQSNTETVAVHRVLEAWTEGMGDGTVGEASHVYRQPFFMWTNAGASPPGSATGSLVSFTPATIGLRQIAFDKNVVQAWLDGPSTNHGFVLIPSGVNSSRIASREAAVGQRPELIITYR